jgi:ATP-dependent DNA helicase HFM1/MER3
MDMLQMIGRAGRPQFDTHGVAVVLTTNDEKRSCENMVLGKEMIESVLHENLIEHLNAEIVLGSINSLKGNPF